jgi:putative cell wall-binding protein
MKRIMKIMLCCLAMALSAQVVMAAFLTNKTDELEKIFLNPQDEARAFND